MKEIKYRVVKHKCLRDALVWLGFEYEKTNDGYKFERSYNFDMAWKDMHYLRSLYYRK